MKKIRMALSIAVLLGTVAVIGISNSQIALASDAIEAGVKCDCEYENPHSWGVIRDGDCKNDTCWHAAK